VGSKSESTGRQSFVRSNHGCRSHVISGDSEASQGAFGTTPTCALSLREEPEAVQRPSFANCAETQPERQTGCICNYRPITNLLQTVVRTLLYVTWLNTATRNMANDVAASRA
jgi:hypothetical protein